MKNKFILLISLFLFIDNLLIYGNDTISVTYIANCGHMVEIDSQKIIIDGLFKRGHNRYITPDTITQKLLITKQSPLNDINLILVTQRILNLCCEVVYCNPISMKPEETLIAPCGMNCALCIGYQRPKNRCPGCNQLENSEGSYLAFSLNNPLACGANVLSKVSEQEPALSWFHISVTAYLPA